MGISCVDVADLWGHRCIDFLIDSLGFAREFGRAFQFGGEVRVVSAKFAVFGGSG